MSDNRSDYANRVNPVTSKPVKVAYAGNDNAAHAPAPDRSLRGDRLHLHRMTPIGEAFRTLDREINALEALNEAYARSSKPLIAELEASRVQVRDLVSDLSHARKSRDRWEGIAWLGTGFTFTLAITLIGVLLAVSPECWG